MRRIPYRLLGTATAAPNDWTELGTSSEALGGLGHTDMLTRFFTNKQRTTTDAGRQQTSAKKQHDLAAHGRQALGDLSSPWRNIRASNR